MNTIDIISKSYKGTSVAALDVKGLKSGDIVGLDCNCTDCGDDADCGVEIYD